MGMFLFAEPLGRPSVPVEECQSIEIAAVTSMSNGTHCSASYEHTRSRWSGADIENCAVSVAACCGVRKRSKASSAERKNISGKEKRVVAKELVSSSLACKFRITFQALFLAS